METTTQSNNDFLPPEGRPQFLSVLCILTWICSGLIFISTMWAVIFPPSPEDTYEQIEKMRAVSPDAADRMEAAFESQTPMSKAVSNVFTLLGLTLTVIGSMQMWQQRKKGFYFYLGGELLPYLAFLFTGTKAFAAMGAMSSMSENTIAALAISIMLVFDGIFIAMYAVNLKHMNN